MSSTSPAQEKQVVETSQRSDVLPESGWDPARVRADFPVLTQRVYDKPLVYLDTANSSQKPQVVIDAVSRFYSEDYSNIHRGLHMLSERATRMFNQVRGKVQRFMNAREHSEVIFVRGATEGINLVASSWGRSQLQAGDEILVTGMEHHSNIVPWQMLCAEKRGDATTCASQ